MSPAVHCDNTLYGRTFKIDMFGSDGGSYAKQRDVHNSYLKNYHKTGTRYTMAKNSLSTSTYLNPDLGTKGHSFYARWI